MEKKMMNKSTTLADKMIDIDRKVTTIFDALAGRLSIFPVIR